MATFGFASRRFWRLLRGGICRAIPPGLVGSCLAWQCRLGPGSHARRSDLLPSLPNQIEIRTVGGVTSGV